MNNWDWNLDELVDKVMSDLRDGRLNKPSNVSALLTNDFRSIQSPRPKEDKLQESLAFGRSQNDALDDGRRLNDVVELTERVIYSEVVKKLISQTSCRRWKVCSHAVITPSAKDELRKRNIELFFEDRTISSNTAEKGDVLDRRTPSKGRITFSASNAPGDLMASSKNSAEEISKRPKTYLANHLPDAERVPSNVRDYLSRNSSLIEVRFSCLKEASRQIQNAVTSDKQTKAFLTTHDGAIASIWCNRLSGVRAVAAFSYDQVCGDVDAANANVLIVDPNRVGVYQFRRIVDYYLRSEIK